jgi:hypothetical protein
VGIKIISLNQNAGNYKLLNNSIEAVNGNGISANAAFGVQAIGNSIKLSGNTTNGIELTGCDGANVSCNYIAGRYPSVGYNNRGIYGSMNNNCYISCNVNDSTKTGIYFSSTNLGTKLRGNEMKRHNIGLYLDNTAVIDTQSHAGNRWTGNYTSTYGAWNQNWQPLNQVRLSLFVVDPTLGGVFNPTIPLVGAGGVPDDNGWFDQIVGSDTYDCNGNLLCTEYNQERSSGSNNLKEAIAGDSTITSDFIEESKSTAKLFLYDILKQDSNSYSSNVVLMQFLADNVNTTFGKLNNVKQLMKEASVLDYSNTMLLNEKDSLINIHLNNIYLLDSIAATDSTIDNLIARENEIDELNSLKQDVSNVLVSANVNKTTKLSEATIWNNAVQPSEIPEYNLKQVNDINLIYKQTVSKDSIIQYYSTLLNIATQCPQSGGVAVYIARSLITLFNDSIIYEDENNCLQQGYYRLASKHGNSNLPSDILVMPNPAFDETQIKLINKDEGICSVSITDAYSKIVYTRELDCKQQQLLVLTKAFTPGVYYIKINLDNNFIKTAKLMITR